MRFCSPLRYPGGKAFLASELERIIEKIGLNKPIYVEPYAGGAGAALALLFAGKVKRIVINDKDPAIYAFWRAVKNRTDDFAKKILSTPVTVAQWRKQRKIYENKNADEFERGFATFFLNRTNRSGVMNAWPIGGVDQMGAYKINARYNKKDLVQRIKKIGEYANRITVLNEDGIALTKRYLGKKSTFIYLDPPYFKKGAMLYMNHYQVDDHVALARLLNENCEQHWVLTYDQTEPIKKLYQKRRRRRLDLSYRVHTARNARELMFFSNTTFV